MRRLFVVACGASLLLLTGFDWTTTPNAPEDGQPLQEAHLDDIKSAFNALESGAAEVVSAFGVAMRYECAFPVQADENDTLGIDAYQCPIPTDTTLLRVHCNTSNHAAQIQVYSRAEATPNSGTTNLLDATLECDTNGSEVTAFTNDQLSAKTLLAFGVTSSTLVEGEVLRIFVEGRRNVP